jgi:hypothetical protein
MLSRNSIWWEVWLRRCSGSVVGQPSEYGLGFVASATSRKAPSPGDRLADHWTHAQSITEPSYHGHEQRPGQGSEDISPSRSSPGRPHKRTP